MNAKQQTRIRLVLAGVVLICGVSLMALVYLIINKPVAEVKPSIVVSTPSPVAVPVMNTQNMLLRRDRSIARYTPYNVANPYRWEGTFSSQTSLTVYTTSNAAVRSVGGGTNGSAFALATTSHSSQRGIQQGAIPVTTFVAMASSRQVAAPEAGEAPQMAHLASYDPRRAPGPPDLGGDDLPGDHQLVETPVGEGGWIMILFALMYLCSVYAAGIKSEE